MTSISAHLEGRTIQQQSRKSWQAPSIAFTKVWKILSADELAGLVYYRSFRGKHTFIINGDWADLSPLI